MSRFGNKSKANYDLLTNATYGLSALKTLLNTIETELTFKQQTLATLNQANPVQNTWYTVLDTTLNCRVLGISVRVATTGEDLEVQVTIDGQTINGGGGIAVAANTHAYVTISNSALTESALLSITDTRVSRAFLIEGRSVKVQVRKTSAAGAGNLYATVSYATR